MESKSHLRRWNFLTHKRLQLRFALMSTAFIFFSTIGAWLLMQWILKSSLTGHWWGPSPDIEMLNKANYIIWFVVLADVFAVFFISITFSHSVAGPLYRIEMSLAELVEQGKTKKIHLRKYDMLQETASLVNQVIAKYSTRPN